jgi:hypothetical protein
MFDLLQRFDLRGWTRYSCGFPALTIRLSCHIFREPVQLLPLSRPGRALEVRNAAHGAADEPEMQGAWILRHHTCRPVICNFFAGIQQ